MNEMSRFRPRNKDLVEFEKSIMAAIWKISRWDVNSLRRKAKTHYQRMNAVKLQTLYIWRYSILFKLWYKLDIESDLCAQEINGR